MKFESGAAKKFTPVEQTVIMKKPPVIEELSDEDVTLDDDAEELGEGDYEIIDDKETTRVMKRPPELRKIESKETGPKFQIGAATEASPDHPDRNEDANFSSPKRGILGVFDGMGGVPAGDFASATAARQLTSQEMNHHLENAKTPEAIKSAGLIKKVFDAPKEAIQRQEDVEEATKALIQRMNDEVEKLGRENPEVQQKAIEYFTKEVGKYDPTDPDHQRMMKGALGSVGCTASFMKMWRGRDGKDRVTVGQIGDSRIYRLRGGKLEQLTKDDSHVQILKEEGLIKSDEDVNQPLDKQTIIALANKRPELKLLIPKLVRSPGDTVRLGDFRANITQGIGIAALSKQQFGLDFKPQAATYELEDGDALLDLSDGVVDNLTDTEIQEIAARYANNPSQLTRELQQASTARGIKGKNFNPRAKKDDVTALAAVYRKG